MILNLVKGSSLFTILCILEITSLLATTAAGEPPARVLNLSEWKLMLPVSTVRQDRADEIQQPQLNSFVDPQWFFALETDRSDTRGVVFRAHCGGSTSKGSKYPRSELREMREEGRKPAAWATDDGGTHTMRMTVAITATPPIKRHVVCAQIHDADNDVIMIRLEGSKLLVERGSQPDVVLDPDYRLGKSFDLEIQAAQGRVLVSYNKVPKLDWKISRAGCYFKAGCYTQSNVSKGDAPESFGEVIIYRLAVEHR